MRLLANEGPPDAGPPRPGRTQESKDPPARAREGPARRPGTSPRGARGWNGGRGAEPSSFTEVPAPPAGPRRRSRILKSLARPRVRAAAAWASSIRPRLPNSGMGGPLKGKAARRVAARWSYYHDSTAATSDDAHARASHTVLMLTGKLLQAPALIRIMPMLMVQVVTLSSMLLLEPMAATFKVLAYISAGRASARVAGPFVVALARAAT